ncbi:MAG TPA: FAD-dependent oxidoreductase [Pseudonocardiaceae bacterium]|nr:FAD-dependent oxidoreductase [Pseudonocardiaceae bacterium]
MKVAVVGAGVVGLATTAALLDAGADVTCFEAVEPMSQRSTGASRIFRLAHPNPVLVELAAKSREAFGRWSALAGRALVSEFGTVGTVVAGPQVSRWASAMAAAGAAHEVRDSVDESLALPVRSIDGPCLVDPAGGVVDAEGVAKFLLAATRQVIVRDTVYRVEEGAHATVRTAAGSRGFDAVVIAAGLGTWQLALQVGLYTPSTVEHHVRLTFPIGRRRPAAERPPALIDRSETWRPGFTTYQHLAAPGRWAVGAHFDPAAVAWEVGRERAVEVSRRRTVEYVRENLDGVAARAVDEVYCSTATGWTDGYGIARTAHVIALHGVNLFKLAPVIGQVLAGAALDGSLPESTLTR